MTPHPVVVSAQTTRVAVIDGHTESVSVSLDAKPSIDAGHRGDARVPRPAAGARAAARAAAAIVWLEAADRPQPRLDAERDGGMTVTVGRVRRCPVLDIKFIALGHNTIRGAAGAAVLNAELLQAEGLLQGD